MKIPTRMVGFTKRGWWWPRRTLDWVPNEITKKEGKRRGLRNEVQEAMKFKMLEEDVYFDRTEWKLRTEKLYQQNRNLNNIRLQINTGSVYQSYLCQIILYLVLKR